mmetsp:Transcript_13592/g.20584  ORF Transcript_13592/g.20584 Transcript_13592/m.20584 type:complete len:416 (-) Transcript_13592:50-1297(-)
MDEMNPTMMDDQHETDYVPLKSEEVRGPFQEKQAEREDSENDEESEETLLRKKKKIKKKKKKEHKVKRDYNRFVIEFPDSLERILYRFDTIGIAICQITTSWPTQVLGEIIRLLTLIETGITFPYILFILGLDSLALQFAIIILLTLIISQIPKRFVYRKRPWVVSRAKKKGNESTSSFPSRAVTCAVIYGYQIGYLVRYITYSDASDVVLAVHWVWMPILCLIFFFAASWARVNRGVHYPSDCVAGGLQGLFVIVLGSGIYQGFIQLCPTCYDNECYARYIVVSIEQFIKEYNIYVMLGLSFLFLVLCLACVAPPIEFYTKFHYVFGLTLPCITFQVVFLCKPWSLTKMAALTKPPESVVNRLLSLLYGISTVILFSVFGALAPKTKLGSVLTFTTLYISGLLSLMLWRYALGF